MPVPLICQYIETKKEEVGAWPICKVLTGAGVKIAPSTYYAAKTRSPSARSLRDETLKAEISKVHKDNYSVLGARKIHVMLNRPEIAERHGAGHVARCTVERLMGDLGLRGVRRAKSPRTTRSAPKEQCPADLVKRHVSSFRPNELWVADIPSQAGGAPSYVRTFSGWVYVAFITDVYSQRIIGWQTSTSRCTDLALDALRMAVWQRKRRGADLSGLVHHSDRGVQYRSIRYGQALSECEAVASVGSTGDSYDNALAEALNSLYKAELIRNQGPWEDIDAARGRHRRVGPLVQHHPATLRHRDANPRRARSRLGTRPPPPGTITTGNHRHQINQPPQNPGLDTASTLALARAPSSGLPTARGWRCTGQGVCVLHESPTPIEYTRTRPSSPRPSCIAPRRRQEPPV